MQRLQACPGYNATVSMILPPKFVGFSWRPLWEIEMVIHPAIRQVPWVLCVDETQAANRIKNLPANLLTVKGAEKCFLGMLRTRP
jgi:hypothetical protein